MPSRQNWFEQAANAFSHEWGRGEGASQVGSPNPGMVSPGSEVTIPPYQVYNWDPETASASLESPPLDLSDCEDDGEFENKD